MSRKNKNHNPNPRIEQRFKRGDVVRFHSPKGKDWYGVVHLYHEMGSNHAPQPLRVTCAAFCLEDGRPYDKPRRVRVEEALLSAAEVPERFYKLGGSVPSELPGEKIPGGTPPRRFPDAFRVGDEVSIKRTRHGWFDGRVSGTITHMGDYAASVKITDGGDCFEEGDVVHIERPGDIY